jgi:heme/copper-type cytochrome/quinol oxidase subunit 2
MELLVRAMASRLPRIAVLLIAFTVVVIVLEAAAMACPSCKESLGHSDPARANMVRGYFWSILFMMSMPFLILGGLSTLFWWEIRKAKRKQAAEAAMLQNTAAEAREPVEV